MHFLEKIYRAYQFEFCFLDPSVHTTHKEEGLSKLNADTLVRVILVM